MNKVFKIINIKDLPYSECSGYNKLSEELKHMQVHRYTTPTALRKNIKHVGDMIVLDDKLILFEGLKEKENPIKEELKSKRCNGCDEKLPLNSFTTNGLPNTYKSKCKDCTKIINKKYYENKTKRITCECGTNIREKELNNHIITSKHIKRMEIKVDSEKEKVIEVV